MKLSEASRRDWALLVMRLALASLPLTEWLKYRMRFPNGGGPVADPAFFTTSIVGILLLIGLWTRGAALYRVLAAIFQGFGDIWHAGRELPHFSFLYVMLFVGPLIKSALPLSLVFAGAGRFSVDATLKELPWWSLNLNKFSDYGLAAARGALGLSLVFANATVFFSVGLLTNPRTAPSPAFLIVWLAGLLFGTTLALGFQTRMSAIGCVILPLLSQLSLIPSLAGQPSELVSPLIPWGTYRLAIATISIAILGGGPYSLDAKFAKQASASATVR